MKRQCAWCLCFMDCLGEPISIPQPKNYAVSHGMCRACGSLWLEQATGAIDEQTIRKTDELVREVTELMSKVTEEEV